MSDLAIAIEHAGRRPGRWVDVGDTAAIRQRPTSAATMCFDVRIVDDDGAILLCASVCVDVVRVAAALLKRVRGMVERGAVVGDKASRARQRERRAARRSRARDRRGRQQEKRADRRKRQAKRFRDAIRNAAKAIAKLKIIDRLRGIYRKILSNKQAVKAVGTALGGPFGYAIATAITTNDLVKQGQLPKGSLQQIYELGCKATPGGMAAR